MSERYAVDSTRTVFALASGSLPSAIALIRCSGPAAFAIGAQLVPDAAPALAKSERLFQYARFHGTHGVVDRGILLAFPAASAPTGEDTIELHCHGSVAVVRALEAALLAAGAFPALAGEFSYRAFLHGRMTGEELDALGDLYRLRRPEVLSALQRQPEALASEWTALREQLLRLQAVLDTAIDFSDEYAAVVTQSTQPLRIAKSHAALLVERYERVVDDRFTPQLVLAGRPNAGKSSLFNALLGTRRALVSAEAGTTRDFVAEEISFQGRTLRLVDTAGFHAATSQVEQEGIAAADRLLTEAAGWVLVVDGRTGLSTEDERLLARHGDVPYTLFWNKNDLGTSAPPAGHPVVVGSAKTGAGLEALLASLVPRLAPPPSAAGPVPSAHEVRQLRLVVTVLDRLEAELAQGVVPEVAAERSRAALVALTELQGPVSAEEVLDRVFASFCIGK